MALPAAGARLFLDPKRGEHDACGVGFVADLKGRQPYDRQGRRPDPRELPTHRGAAGADPLAGDGAGILVQIPHAFLKE